MLTTAATISERKDDDRKSSHKNEQWYHRAISYPTRHSTLASTIFFDQWYKYEDTTISDDEVWKSIPLRINAVACHFLTSPELSMTEYHSFTQRIDYSINGMKNRCNALTASVLALAPHDFCRHWIKLFLEVLRHRTLLWEQEKDDIDMEETVYDIDESMLFRDLQILQWLPKTLERSFHLALDEAINEKAKDKIQKNFEDGTFLLYLLRYKDEVVVPFVQDALGEDYYRFNYYRNFNMCRNAISVHDSKKISVKSFDRWDFFLQYQVSYSFVKLRINEIFEIVAEYPDSLPAVHDLGLAILQTNMLNELGCALKISFENRLLHPGAQTGQILQVYINAVKVLRLLEKYCRSSGSSGNDNLNASNFLVNIEKKILEEDNGYKVDRGTFVNGITSRIRAYLRGRKDTIRCIITSLIDEESGWDLHEELQRQDVKPLEQILYDSDDDDDPPSFSWKPAASFFYGLGSSNQDHSNFEPERGGSGDILSMLVGIYGSKDLFVDEYRLMLADKLLANMHFKIDKEVINLELLKLRFGEKSFCHCEVMIKDLEDSKRINSNIHRSLSECLQRWQQHHDGDFVHHVVDGSVVNTTIISHIFWPALQKETINHHSKVQALLDAFSTEYAKLKNPRRLVWFKQLGRVTVELDFAMETDESLNQKKLSQTRIFNCTPLQATLIFHFEDEHRWTVEKLSIISSTPLELIRKKMSFWVQHRVVRPSKVDSMYELILPQDYFGDEKDRPEQDNRDTHSLLDFVTDFHDEGEGEMTVSEQLEGKLEEIQKTYESYVVGMLANLGQLPLERIHNMLKILVVSGSDQQFRYNKTPGQLRYFLQKMCYEEKLEYTDGMYKLFLK